MRWNSSLKFDKRPLSDLVIEHEIKLVIWETYWCELAVKVFTKENLVKVLLLKGLIHQAVITCNCILPTWITLKPDVTSHCPKNWKYLWRWLCVLLLRILLAWNLIQLHSWGTDLLMNYALCWSDKGVHLPNQCYWVCFSSPGWRCQDWSARKKEETNIEKWNLKKTSLAVTFFFLIKKKNIDSIFAYSFAGVKASPLYSY